MPELKDKLADLRKAIDVKRGEAQTAWTAFTAERDKLKADGVDVTTPGFSESEDFKQAEQAHKDYGRKADELAAMQSQRERLQEMAADSGGLKAVEDPALESERKGVSGARKAPGDRVIESEEYKQLVQSGVLSSQSARVGSAPMGKAFKRGEFKDLVTGVSGTSGGAFVTNDDAQPFVDLARRPLLVRNLITVGETDSDTVEYVRQTGRTNNAAETPEATGTAGSGLKPESALAYERIAEAVRTVAHFIPATKRALADAGQLRTLIDADLRDGLLQRLETQILSGNGTGENLRGIQNTPGIQTIARDTVGAENRPDAIHKAMTLVRLAFYEPTAVGLHPNDWQDIRLEKDANANYLYGPPSQAGTQMIWGAPIVSGVQFTEGTGVVGDYSRATLWLREDVQVLASDSHADFFLRNMVAILAELRAAFGVRVPAAFATVTAL
jgi:HK97 family phage major capsid protein